MRGRTGRGGRGLAPAILLVAGAAISLAILIDGRFGKAERAPRSELVIRRAHRIAGEVSRLRGLTPRAPLCFRLVSQAGMLDRVRARVRSEYRPDEIAREGQLLAMLGLIDRPDGYERRVYALLERNLTGFYDLGERCVLLPSWLDWEDQVGTVVHETTHALQDQHFDLDALLRHVPGESDRQGAASAIVEGDATALSLAFLEGGEWHRSARIRAFRRGQFEPAPSRRPDPLRDHLNRTLTFTYADGLSFTARRYRHGGWAAVDAQLRDPPRSTEAVLHPERSAAALVPVSIRIGPIRRLEPGSRRVFEETLGELMLRSLLERWLPRAEASAAVGGWGGDRAVVFEARSRPGSQALLVSTMWDVDEGDEDRAATRFAAALIRALARRHGGPVRSQRGVTVIRGAGARCAAVSRSGRTVVYLENIPCGIAADLAGEVSGATRHEAPSAP